MRTTITFEGNLADDPQVRFLSGKQITEITVLVNQRRPNGAGGVDRRRADPARRSGVQDPGRERRRVTREGRPGLRARHRHY
jgi:hypothetical protein